MASPDPSSRFAEGNRVALTHGAWSPAVVEPVASGLVETARQQAPYLADPSYLPALTAWARAESRSRLLTEYLDQNGYLDKLGRPRAAATLLLSCERLSAQLRSELGLTPASRAKLRRDLAAGELDLARMLS